MINSDILEHHDIRALSHVIEHRFDIITRTLNNIITRLETIESRLGIEPKDEA